MPPSVLLLLLMARLLLFLLSNANCGAQLLRTSVYDLIPTTASFRSQLLEFSFYASDTTIISTLQIELF
jgi:hypothetical protein